MKDDTKNHPVISMDQERLVRLRKLVVDGALGSGPVTDALVRELLADRDWHELQHAKARAEARALVAEIEVRAEAAARVAAKARATTNTKPLEHAIETRVREYDKAIERLRELSAGESGELSQAFEEEVFELTALLRESVDIARCLGRLTQGRTLAELHRAFGAPGDFGYETPIGEALDRVYRTSDPT